MPNIDVFTPNKIYLSYSRSEPNQEPYEQIMITLKSGGKNATGLFQMVLSEEDIPVFLAFAEKVKRIRQNQGGK
ncbi:hypothetical protein [Syntrophomonas palmitatica]|uniref:hypothetical protein n=1 Tax=Syntrophomonas palmitatica TaxID=402877 RepID=UPI0006D14126|nr:hypothetical protein [Syntrophomonas palmitatica]